MAAIEDDYSVYSHLTDAELLQIAVERSLSDQPSTSSSLSSSSAAAAAAAAAAAPAVPTQTNPRQRFPDPPDQVPNSVNPPTGPFMFLYRGRQFSPLQSVIMNGDCEALMELVNRGCSSVTELSDDGWTALHEAAYYGQLQCVKILVTAHPDSVNRLTLKHESALLLAAIRGRVSCADFLLKYGANPNLANKERETPLFAACEQPNEAIVDLLLKSGAKVNLCNSQGTSALHEACRHGQLQLCRTLLKSGANLQTANIYGIQPFFTAAQHGHVDVLHLLAEKGADINTQAKDGASPLFEACKNGHVSAVEALLALKADANRPMKSCLMPLHVAIQNHHTRIVSMLIPVTNRSRVQHSGISPLHIAAENNRDDIMEQLIESGFDVNTKLSDDRCKMYEDRRRTALYFSVYNGNLEAAEMLLEAGADPNLDVFNPLLIAVRLCRMDMATLLLSYGADVNSQISTQPSSFPAAILLRMESLHMLKLLLDHGCDAQRCFHCPYGQKIHPAITPSCHPAEELRLNRHAPPKHCIQFCEAISSSSFHRVAGPIISLLLDYVNHVRLCSRLLEILESHEDWAPIKLKAFPPRPLMQLCRLEIRRVVGIQRLKLLHTLPLPVSLLRFLQYNVQCSLHPDMFPAI